MWGRSRTWSPTCLGVLLSSVGVGASGIRRYRVVLVVQRQVMCESCVRLSSEDGQRGEKKRNNPVMDISPGVTARGEVGPLKCVASVTIQHRDVPTTASTASSRATSVIRQHTAESPLTRNQRRVVTRIHRVYSSSAQRASQTYSDASTQGESPASPRSVSSPSMSAGEGDGPGLLRRRMTRIAARMHDSRACVTEGASRTEHAEPSRGPSQRVRAVDADGRFSRRS
jgi:hypothetical protein